ncbi:hypothetical protein Cfla_3616 [Cellulomonas flavigena DSM 20109]|uniref:WD40 domain protein beta Propeller n=1 Tax=Cellulomonas flavigena (strain ATCC 482 / DSM 20109 / BCRC 11376 / JCM 18109 / NBRC 3775 / NCIMB 8073 / NRS 134) TaxID=446466 RepID=D5UDN1_CELFN|nr:hypothetical protein [Cellulomonas flavigena]ADG76487.1 hypothetical protein Cfla_3616 [Cellulomonas flavigena DSM 20109]
MNRDDVANLTITVAVVTATLVLGSIVPGAGRSPDAPPPADAAVTPVATVAAPPSSPAPAGARGTTAPLRLADLPAGALDPAGFPARRVEQAVLIADVGADGLVAIDAATGQWVSTGLVPPISEPLLLSPDGRSLATLAYQDAGMRVEIVELLTGAAREVPVNVPPPPGDSECRVDGVAWSPDGHLGVVAMCMTFHMSSDDGPREADYEAVVLEVDVLTGATRVVERVPEASPVEAYPSYSPDGALFAYGIGRPLPAPGWVDESWFGVRVIGVHDDRPAREWVNTHMAYGDPWRDAGTLLVWDELADPGGPAAYLLLDTSTGAQSPYGIDRLTNTLGFVGGSFLAQRTRWLQEPDPCPAALCAVDLDSGVVAPWLDLPERGDVHWLGVARDLVGP